VLFFLVYIRFLAMADGGRDIKVAGCGTDRLNDSSFWLSSFQLKRTWTSLHASVAHPIFLASPAPSDQPATRYRF
jgi:hypothetical protein